MNEVKKWSSLSASEQKAYWAAMEKIRAYKAQGVEAKRCKKCGEVKPLTEFYVQRGNIDGRSGECGRCNYIRSRQWIKNNSIAAKARRHKRDKHGVKQHRRACLKQRYGLTAAEYIAMYERQGGLCAITGLSLGPHLSGSKGTTKHALDHDKATGQVRELIFGNINRGMGSFDHNPVWLRAAANYLDKHNAIHAGLPIPQTPEERIAELEREVASQNGGGVSS
ncbi:MAG TPA: endonuclease domain-containing protein [Roseiarcus sp.]|nr:endonuclease domain-containing protein [Roseiarcus sp.]